jgi:flap endonuclease-1
MGIQGLMKVIADHAPGAIKENVIKNFFGRKICIDASMSLYQFLIAVRPDDTNSFTLTNDVGETTRYCFHPLKSIEVHICPILFF